MNNEEAKRQMRQGKRLRHADVELLNGSAIGTEFSIPKEKEVQEKLKVLYTKGTQVQHSL